MTGILGLENAPFVSFSGSHWSVLRRGWRSGAAPSLSSILGPMLICQSLSQNPSLARQLAPGSEVSDVRHTTQIVFHPQHPVASRHGSIDRDERYRVPQADPLTSNRFIVGPLKIRRNAVYRFLRELPSVSRFFILSNPIIVLLQAEGLSILMPVI